MTHAELRLLSETMRRAADMTANDRLAEWLIEVHFALEGLKWTIEKDVLDTLFISITNEAENVVLHTEHIAEHNDGEDHPDCAWCERDRLAGMRVAKEGHHPADDPSMNSIEFTLREADAIRKLKKGE